ncbi:MAG: cyanoexosortase A system-associated protein [Cyanobacteria bacterium QH_2_48_84]|nr:MAG: cyanoexosortase A system-associated protein [Cyanobacteria bacterium QH_2_48_84]
MILSKPLRIPMLAITFGGVVFALGQSILAPTISTDKKASSFSFPSKVPLPGWQLVETRSLKDPPGRNYQYTRNTLPMEIEMRYVAKAFPNQMRFRKYNESTPSSPEKVEVVRQQGKVGFYGLYIEQQQANLRSCINPRGGSTINYEQFIKNRYTYDLQPTRLVPWLFGQETLKDERCLWTHLSIPLEDVSPKEAYQILENAWFKWYQWWYPRFRET